jgi:hypothetical protein
MSKFTAKYRFIRPPNSIVAFGRSNRASTDAVGALHRWRDMEPEREFDVTIDHDEEICATLTFAAADQTAGSHLEALCTQHGVERQFISQE